MDEATKQPRRLVKKSKEPPPVSFLNSSRNNTLRRAPSAPTYPSFTSAAQSNLSHRRSPTLDAKPFGQSSSASTSLRQPSAPSPHDPYDTYDHYDPLTPHVGLPQASASSSQASLTTKTTPELVGQPFDSAAVTSEIHKASHHATRPPPPQHSQTADPPKFKSPRLRQSASFTALARKIDNIKMDTITPPRSDGGTKSPRQRYSDEGDTTQKKRNSGGGKKKSAFSTFVQGLVGSPRRPTISTPTNPMHVTHVSIDHDTGEFTVRGHPLILSP